MPHQQVPPAELSVTPLNKGLFLGEFDCGDADLNEFVRKDAFTYEEKGIARTYVCLWQNNPVGYFSLCMDAIRLSPVEKCEEFGEEKPHSDYPALKIARLAVATSAQKQGIGMFMVKMAVGKAISLSKEVGCRFATVDAYPGMDGFYSKCGFVKNLGDHSGQNLSMRLDLIEATKPAS